MYEWEREREEREIDLYTMPKNDILVTIISQFRRSSISTLYISTEWNNIHVFPRFQEANSLTDSQSKKSRNNDTRTFKGQVWWIIRILDTTLLLLFNCPYTSKQDDFNLQTLPKVGIFMYLCRAMGKASIHTDLQVSIAFEYIYCHNIFSREKR